MTKGKKQNTVPFLDHGLWFPSVETANADGLLAVGGDLRVERLLLAYKNGIFPWFNENSLILWWSPDPRMVLYPKNISISKSMRKVMRSGIFKLKKNTNFNQVLHHCAGVERKGQEGTWITEEMVTAYRELHAKGVAHSYEVYEGGALVGGLYGIDLGHVFCGESMFSLKPNASKFAFISLAQELQEKGYRCIDCQLYTDHLASLGAQEISRNDYMALLNQAD
ncbi:leucyl/phenylalanyl-tRNA--protein transferase [Maribacter sp. 2307ULW6-5]|uniref:leucyl/phenylalanyl-tRNA--protein transferase n=1 Tax=Maribacter sp. 2307ULW6-5 TaxID=3386275 RepID=UPI0039BD6873